MTDAVALIDFLRAEYDKNKIIVVGYSWGSVVGLMLSQRYPQALHAYVGVGQVINFQKNGAIGYSYALRKARDAGNEDAVLELQSIAPYPESDGSIPRHKIENTAEVANTLRRSCIRPKNSRPLFQRGVSQSGIRFVGP